MVVTAAAAAAAVGVVDSADYSIVAVAIADVGTEPAGHSSSGESQ